MSEKSEVTYVAGSNAGNVLGWCEHCAEVYQGSVQGTEPRDDVVGHEADDASTKNGRMSPGAKVH
jgi:hypothetical protein